MEASSEHPIPVYRRRERDGVPVDDRRLRRLLDAGSLVRVAAGSFVPAEAWHALDPMARHRVRVLEIADRTRGPQVFTHAAAAAIWGVDRVRAWPLRIEVRIAKASGGRSSGAVQRRALGFDGVEIVPWRGHLVTSPAQTAVDIAAESPFVDGVIAMDQVRWMRRAGGAMADARALAEVLARRSGRGMARAHEAFAFSTGLSDSVRESQSRVLLDRLGFPAPVLQRRFVLPGFGAVRSDFFFEEYDHAGEFDGTGKYLDPALLDGMTPAQALIREKDRGDALRRAVCRVSRWRTPALDDPRLLYDILSADGLPSRSPRPRAAATW